jgi:hypothetical protein
MINYHESYTLAGGAQRGLGMKENGAIGVSIE